MKKLCIIILCFLFSSPSYGAFYSESISVGDTAVGISMPAKTATLKRGYFSVEGGNVRWWMDGTTPTSTAGHIGYDKAFIEIIGINNLINLKFIRTGSSTTTVSASYED